MQPKARAATFEKWLQEKFKGNALLFVGKVNQEFFRKAYLEPLMKHFGVSRIIKIETPQEWEEHSEDLLQASLFENQRTIVLFQEPEEDTFFKVKKLLTHNPALILIGVLKNKPKRLHDVPQVVLRNLSPASTLPRSIAQSLSRMPSASVKKLIHYWHEMDLKEEDVIQFLGCFPNLQNVKPEDVEAYFESEEKSILFHFLDATIEGETEKALTYLDLLLKKGFPHTFLVSSLTRKLRLILQCLEEQQPVDLWTERKVNNYELRKIAQQCKKFSLQKIKIAFRILRESDRMLKTSSVPPGDILLDMVIKLTGL